MRLRIPTCPLTLLLVLFVLPVGVLADYAPDELIIKLKPGKKTSSVSVSAVAGAQVKSRNAKHGLMRIKLPKGASLVKAMESYRKDPSVEYAGPNHILKIASTFPNDPLFRDGIDLYGMGFWYTHPQWGLYNDGNNNGNGGTYRADIHAPEAWDITTGSPNVVIAVIDTGCDYYHPDLIGKMWTNPGEIGGNRVDDDGNGYVDDVMGWDFVNNDADPMDDHVQEDPFMGDIAVHHGTFTVSIAAADSNNGDGMAGVAWGCPVLPLKVMDSVGYGLESDVAEAIYYAADLGVKVINMSLAGTDDVPVLADAVEYAWQHGAICICASGNEDVGIDMYPASYPHALAVGATNENDERCTAADWMEGGSNYGSYLDVMAPGNEIIGATDVVDIRGYFNLPGTSAATPFVSGIAALLWSAHPEWTNAQVFYQILLTTDDLGVEGWDQYTGWGRVNAYRALTGSVRMQNRVAPLKSFTSSTRVVLDGVVLSTSSEEIPGRLYVQDADGTSGICLYFSSGQTPTGFVEGDVVQVIGPTGTISGERAMMNPSIIRTGATTPPKPVAMVSSAMGGGTFGLQFPVVDKRYPSPSTMSTGVNNTGKLITITGKVTGVYYDWFFIDDGCGLDDGSGYAGVYVYQGGLDRPGIGQYAAVTGISSCEYIPGSTSLRHRVLRPRRQADIRVLQ